MEKIEFKKNVIIQVTNPDFNGTLKFGNRTMCYKNQKFIDDTRRVYRLVSKKSKHIIHPIESIEEFGLFACFAQDYFSRHPKAMSLRSSFQKITNEWNTFKLNIPE
jgi:hypothetical protein